MFAIWISKRSLTVLEERSVESHEVLGYDKKQCHYLYHCML